MVARTRRMRARRENAGARPSARAPKKEFCSSARDQVHEPYKEFYSSSRSRTCVPTRRRGLRSPRRRVQPPRHASSRRKAACPSGGAAVTADLVRLYARASSRRGVGWRYMRFSERAVAVRVGRYGAAARQLTRGSREMTLSRPESLCVCGLARPRTWALARRVMRTCATAALAPWRERPAREPASPRASRERLARSRAAPAPAPPAAPPVAPQAAPPAAPVRARQSAFSPGRTPGASPSEPGHHSRVPLAFRSRLGQTRTAQSDRPLARRAHPAHPAARPIRWHIRAR